METGEQEPLTFYWHCYELADCRKQLQYFKAMC